MAPPGEVPRGRKVDVEAGEITREDVAAVLGVDLAEVDAENARDRARQDQMSPGTWTTLPDGVSVDDWMFDITDPERAPSHGSFIKIDDRGTTVEIIDSRWIGPSMTRGLSALVFRDFGGVTDKELKEAKEYIRTRPDMRSKLKEQIDSLFA
ncbi:hypothetical protein GOL26_28745 [Sinorhizobium medicae]|nr:hypothetical protein [Sinorhizobium medicae]MDX0998862.1 hypothetical protein [Sinorhizobium medicae]MDX1182807.1 hypothetical protein [Sinorhizobium medicae]